MLGIDDLGLFLVAGLVLNLTPGVDLLYVLQRTGSGGFKTGTIAALGIAAGCLIHICFAVVGLSAIIMASASAFTIIKYLGVCYLIYLGVKLILDGTKIAELNAPIKQDSFFVVFKQGVLINVLNPKVALFFLAFIPQFIDPDSTQKSLAFLVLGLLFNLNSTLVLFVIAWMTDTAKSKMGKIKKYNKTLKFALGFGFIGLGVKLALDR